VKAKLVGCGWLLLAAFNHGSGALFCLFAAACAFGVFDCVCDDQPRRADARSGDHAHIPYV
jgi:ABC-type uncharacterized transport system permease subunit